MCTYECACVTFSFAAVAFSIMRVFVPSSHRRPASPSRNRPPPASKVVGVEARAAGVGPPANSTASETDTRPSVTRRVSRPAAGSLLRCKSSFMAWCRSLCAQINEDWALCWRGMKVNRPRDFRRLQQTLPVRRA
eukprot:scaffold124733_cov63-Phaeocystis_antarctica.AAC.2